MKKFFGRKTDSLVQTSILKLELHYLQHINVYVIQKNIKPCNFRLKGFENFLRQFGFREPIEKPASELHLLVRQHQS